MTQLVGLAVYEPKASRKGDEPVQVKRIGKVRNEIGRAHV